MCQNPLKLHGFISSLKKRFWVKKNGQNQFSVKKIGFEKYWAHKMFGPKKFGSEIIGLKKGQMF